MLDDRSTASSTETTANERLLHFMAQLPLGRDRPYQAGRSKEPEHSAMSRVMEAFS